MCFSKNGPFDLMVGLISLDQLLWSPIFSLNCGLPQVVALRDRAVISPSGVENPLPRGKGFNPRSSWVSNPGFLGMKDYSGGGRK